MPHTPFISDLMENEGMLNLKPTNGTEITFQAWVEVCFNLLEQKSKLTNRSTGANDSQ